MPWSNLLYRSLTDRSVLFKTLLAGILRYSKILCWLFERPYLTMYRLSVFKLSVDWLLFGNAQVSKYDVIGLSVYCWFIYSLLDWAWSYNVSKNISEIQINSAVVLSGRFIWSFYLLFLHYTCLFTYINTYIPRYSKLQYKMIVVCHNSVDFVMFCWNKLGHSFFHIGIS